jgi:electron transport complex protein RnfC
VLIIRAINAGDLDEAKRCGLMDCVECGTCAYVCPAHVKLVQRFKVGKQMVRAEAAKETARAAAKESAKGAS